jgi:hypothetical protein
MKVLYLPIKTEYFDQIAAGTKKEEYRMYGEFYRSRLLSKEYDAVLFQNGYRKDARRLLVKYKGFQRKGDIYVIKLGKILERNY